MWSTDFPTGPDCDAPTSETSHESSELGGIMVKTSAVLFEIPSFELNDVHEKCKSKKGKKMDNPEHSTLVDHILREMVQ